MKDISVGGGVAPVILNLFARWAGWLFFPTEY